MCRGTVAAMTDDEWRLLGTLVRRRREVLGLKQGDLARYGGPGVSTVGKIERGEQGSYPRRTRQQIEIALGWNRNAVDEILQAATSEWWDDEGLREDYIETLIQEHIPDLTHPAPTSNRVHTAADLTDDELLAELTYRMKRYATERRGDSGGNTPPIVTRREVTARMIDAAEGHSPAAPSPQPAPGQTD